MGTTAGIRPVTLRARVRLTSNHSIPVTGWPGAAVAFDEEEYDNGRFWDPSLPGRFTIQTAGLYEIGAAARWAAQVTAGAAGWRGVRIIRVRGGVESTLVSQTEMGVIGNQGVEQNVHTEFEALPGDVLAPRFAQTSDGPLDLQGTNFPTAFWISSRGR